MQPSTTAWRGGQSSMWAFRLHDGRSAQAIRGDPTVLVVSRTCNAVGKGRQSSDAGELVIPANRAPFHWGAWKTVWSLCLGVRGPLSRASSAQLPSILCGNCSHSPLLQPVPPVGTRAYGRGSSGQLRDPWWEAWGAGRAPLLFCPQVRQALSLTWRCLGAEWLHWPGLMPWLQLL